jgi:hypothetical protein
MDWEILAYLGAASMVVLALAAYRYWNSTASHALRMKGSHARSLKQRADSSAPTPSDQAGDGSPKVDVRDQDDAVVVEEPAQDQAEPPDIDENSEISHGSADRDPGTSVENPGELPDVEDPQLDEHGRNDSPEPIGRVGTSTAALLRELDEQLAALPSGIELIDLPILERRRIADRREDLLSDRRRLLENSPRGSHRRGRGSRKKD